MLYLTSKVKVTFFPARASPSGFAFGQVHRCVFMCKILLVQLLINKLISCFCLYYCIRDYKAKLVVIFFNKNDLFSFHFISTTVSLNLTKIKQWTYKKIFFQDEIKFRFNGLSQLFYVFKQYHRAMNINDHSNGIILYSIKWGIFEIIFVNRNFLYDIAFSRDLHTYICII